MITSNLASYAFLALAMTQKQAGVGPDPAPVKSAAGLDNAGGEAAHLGGAIAGWYFIKRPEQLHGLFNFFGRVDPTSRHFAIKGGKKRGGRGPDDRQVDRILDKISREGLQSLSKKEKRILAEASKRDSSS